MVTIVFSFGVGKEYLRLKRNPAERQVRDLDVILDFPKWLIRNENRDYLFGLKIFSSLIAFAMFVKSLSL